MSLKNLSELVSLCKQRGFIFQSSEIYGGLNSCWDYGPLGAQLKLNIKNHWWKEMTYEKDIVGLDASILMHPKVWEASQHLETFTDPLRDCKKCQFRFKDEKSVNQCPECGSKDLSESRQFNLMFKTFLGPLEEKKSTVYLRPETAQGIFVNFDNVRTSLRKKLPFGIAQIGKSFRNEITPGNFIFRTREFEQMEMQYFVAPGENKKWFQYWREKRWNYFLSLGFSEKNIRFHEHKKDELAHYAHAAFDIEFHFPFGWNEVEGIHDRGDFDLKQHQLFSSKKLEYFDESSKKTFLPSVIETAVGCDRLCLALLCLSYKKERLKEGEERIVLALPPALAPYFSAVLPLSKKVDLQSLSHKIFHLLSKEFSCDYDEIGSIGKRYRRHDEIGTPYCLTVDFDSLNDKKVTVRDRDTMKQDRVDITQLKDYFLKLKSKT